MTCHLADATGVPRGSLEEGTRDGGKVPAPLAVLRQGWAAAASCGGPCRSGEVNGVSRAFGTPGRGEKTSDPSPFLILGSI